MPILFIEKYQSSIFIRNNILQLSLIAVMVICLIHIGLNYLLQKDNILINGKYGGMVFGLLFGILWFLGFIELIVIYQSDSLKHLLSACRDLLTLAAFGIFLGLLIPKTIKLNMITPRYLLIIPIVGTIFC
jgi:hypothetical protein